MVLNFIHTSLNELTRFIYKHNRKYKTMIMNFLKKTFIEQVYQKRTPIVTQAYNVDV